MRSETGRGWYTVGVLFAMYLLSLMDRQILSLLVDPIRADLGLSDTGISLLQGIAFALFYTLMGLPIAFLADRYTRTRIITAGLVSWSAMTALCGFANSFGQLFLARIGVGVGEATLGPSAYSLIADSFPREKVARAISLYSTAGFIGPGGALFVGGAIVAAVAHLDSVTLPVIGVLRPWQLAFVSIGLLGLPFTLLLLTLKEPPRRSRPGEDASLGALFAQLRAHWRSYAGLILGESMIAIGGYGFVSWVPTVFVRVHHWSIAEAGLSTGTVVAVTGTLGVLAGAALVERLAMRGVQDAILRVMSFGAAGAGFAALLLFLDGPYTALAAIGVFIFFNSIPWGICGAGLQLTTPNRLRARVSATLLLHTNLFGLGVGPTLIAATTDYVFKDPLSVGRSLGVAGVVSSVLAFVIIRSALGPYRRALAEAERLEAAAAAAAAPGRPAAAVAE
jgi:MFS family permease